MSKSVSIRGSLLVSEGSCGGCSTDQSTKPLSLGGSGGLCCDAGLSYDQAAVFSTAVATAGAVGAAFVDVPGLDQFTAVEFLRVIGSAKYRLRFNPTRPSIVGTTALPALGVTAGSATFVVRRTDGTAVTPAAVVFSGATNTPQLVVNAINAAFGAVSAPQPPDGPIARLDSSSRLVIMSPGIGPLATAELSAGAPVDLGLGTVAKVVTGTASDTVDHEGLYVGQFPRSPNAPTKVQVSGVATLDIVAAGRVTA